MCTTFKMGVSFPKCFKSTPRIPSPVLSWSSWTSMFESRHRTSCLVCGQSFRQPQLYHHSSPPPNTCRARGCSGLHVGLLPIETTACKGGEAGSLCHLAHLGHGVGSLYHTLLIVLMGAGCPAPPSPRTAAFQPLPWKLISPISFPCMDPVLQVPD